MPVEGRRVCHDAKGVVVDLEGLVDGLDYHRGPSAVMDNKVAGKALAADFLDGIRHQDDLAEIGLDLFDAPKVGEQPGPVIFRRKGSGGTLWIGVGVTCICRKVEPTDILIVALVMSGSLKTGCLTRQAVTLNAM